MIRRFPTRMNDLTRKRFLQLVTAGSTALLGAVPWRGLANEFDQWRGERVGWARLKTPSPHWKRHAGSDRTLTKFFRDQTTLNIEPVWYEADAEDLAALCAFPLLFSQDAAAVVGEKGRGNLAEYVRRGGFLLVDACHDIRVTPDFEAFLRRQFAFCDAVLPEAKILPLPTSHEIYRCFFQIPEGRPPHTFMGNVYDARKASHGLYGVMCGARMVGIISLCGWQCGWDHVEFPSPSGVGVDVACMRMVVNVYVYAMMQGGAG